MTPTRRRPSVSETKAWGLKRRGVGLLGKYAVSHDEPLQFEGYKIAAFRTRRQARDFLKERQAPERERTDGWRYWLDTRVVRITIEVRDQERAYQASKPNAIDGSDGRG